MKIRFNKEHKWFSNVIVRRRWNCSRNILLPNLYIFTVNVTGRLAVRAAF